MKSVQWKGLQMIDELEEYISRCDNEEEKEEAILSLFLSEIILKFSFAQQIQLYDMFYPKCLKGTTEDGKNLIEFMKKLELSFIVIAREWIADNRIILYVDVCEEEYTLDMQQQYLRKGEKVIRLNQPN